MEISTFDTPEVQITSVLFRNDPASHRLESFPHSMVYEGHEYTFTELGVRYLIKKGQQLIKLFDVSDGCSQYRLKLDAGGRWTLINKQAIA